MRVAMAGFFLMMSGAAMAAPAGSSDAPIPPQPAMSCDSGLGARGTAFGLPQEVAARRTPKSPASSPLRPLPPIEDDEPEATLRPAFHLCAVGQEGPRKVIHRT
ncbi:hypothetical protein HVIM_01216 [Roseomonas mucosa]|uniref:Secreted protein n=2 Tax=Roseomonadaceae TaxID=3385906 RepID=A0A379N1B8_9PROT|nr:hypothetical protein HVIM_01216 [Roseomonas mucosa]QDD99395.1 hypothetical protein ADP8_01216 [Roseomonas mucosa]UZO91589.1 Hypothetical protein RMP42_01216 [Roseomonas mucosa]SUE40639.1 Uncharacterised protein [Roseomonas mucosa]